MNPADATRPARHLMEDFARTTGLDPPGPRPQRYLWTDAFAVCNYLGFFQMTGDAAFRELALRLIDQVHHTLGRFRDDDPRTGWISGLPPDEGELHPAIGGLRIGKSLPARGAGEPYNEQQEWDRDGQYYHYLTKWMHALSRAGSITGNPVFIRWAVELARTAHARFTYGTGERRQMYWKMSTDLSRPLVLSMGQHDPLDGLLTYTGLNLAMGGDTGGQPVLAREIADMEGMVRKMPLATVDPLGIGGLLTDAARLARLMIQGGPVYPGLLESVTTPALDGLGSFSRSRCLERPAGYRLAFRELGLAIGLAGIEQLPAWVSEQPQLFGGARTLRQAEAFLHYMPLKKTIEEFWLDGKNQASRTWTQHREISTVMLATSLAPGGFLEIDSAR